MQPEEVKGIKFFDGLGYDDVAAALAYFSEREVAAGTDLIRVDETGSELYVILAGAVEVKKPTRSEMKVYATLERGEVVGEIALFIDHVRTATVTVVKDMRCLVLTNDDVKKLEQDNPRLALALLRNILGLEIKRFIDASSHAENVSFWI